MHSPDSLYLLIQIVTFGSVALAAAGALIESARDEKSFNDIFKDKP